jgi:hypothetical protein
MNHYSNKRTQRFTAFTVLVVWMFALGVGWAGACHAGVQAAQSPTATNISFLTGGVPASPEQLKVDSHQNAHRDHGTGENLEACSDGSDTIVNSSSGIDPIVAILLPLLASKWFVKLTAVTAVDFPPTVSAPSPHVPLRTRFSRLVL